MPPGEINYLREFTPRTPRRLMTFTTKKTRVKRIARSTGTRRRGLPVIVDITFVKSPIMVWKTVVIDSSTPEMVTPEGSIILLLSFYAIIGKVRINRTLFRLSAFCFNSEMTDNFNKSVNRSTYD